MGSTGAVCQRWGGLCSISFSSATRRRWAGSWADFGLDWQVGFSAEHARRACLATSLAGCDPTPNPKPFMLPCWQNHCTFLRPNHSPTAGTAPFDTRCSNNLGFESGTRYVAKGQILKQPTHQQHASASHAPPHLRQTRDDGTAAGADLMWEARWALPTSHQQHPSAGCRRPYEPASEPLTSPPRNRCTFLRPNH